MAKRKAGATGALAGIAMGFAEVFVEHYDDESVEVMPGAAPSAEGLDVTLDRDDPSKSVIRVATKA